MSKPPTGKETAQGIGCLAVLAFVAVAYCSSGKSDVEKQADVAKAAENKRNGFHCLSPITGAHRQLVDAIKPTLRNPDSFQHVETTITPVNEKGAHMLRMNYRAQNGFGGMAVGDLVAVVMNKDCSFTVVSNKSG
jgi:hypothetical protein